MDYGVTYSKERLTGRGYFTATGSSVVTDLGNMQMFESDFGIKRKEHFSARRGVLSLDRYDAFSSMGVWHITLDEFTTATLALLWSGTANAATSQTIATAATFMATLSPGQAASIGVYGLYTASLTSPVGKVEGPTADYVIDRAGGKIYIPLTSTIAASTACTVTYSAPALTYDNVTALTTLNRPGSLELQAEDDSQAGKNTVAADAVAPVRYIWTFPCILSADKSGQFKADNYREAILFATLTSPMTVKRLTL
jgi:hypothetical protein